MQAANLARSCLKLGFVAAGLPPAFGDAPVVALDPLRLATPGEAARPPQPPATSARTGSTAAMAPWAKVRDIIRQSSFPSRCVDRWCVFMPTMVRAGVDRPLDQS